MAERSKKQKVVRKQFHRLSDEEQAKARKYAQAEATKSCKHDTTNRTFSQTEGFQALCEAAGVPATSRQASKYRNRCGIVYKTQKGI